MRGGEESGRRDGPGMWECRNGDFEIGGELTNLFENTHFHCTVSKPLRNSR